MRVPFRQHCTLFTPWNQNGHHHPLLWFHIDFCTVLGCVCVCVFVFSAATTRNSSQRYATEIWNYLKLVVHTVCYHWVSLKLKTPCEASGYFLGAGHSVGVVGLFDVIHRREFSFTAQWTFSRSQS